MLTTSTKTPPTRAIGKKTSTSKPSIAKTKSTNISSMLQLQNIAIPQSLAKSFRKIPTPRFLNSLLYSRYSSTQNYHFIKIINTLILLERCPSTFFFRDLLDYQNSHGTIMEFIPLDKYNEFMHHLVEYYKYHNEIPRLFCTEIFEAYFDYHDLKRQINYEDVTRKLQLEKGEDPYNELKKELRKRRMTQYKPMLVGISKASSHPSLLDNDTSNLSRTIEDIFWSLRHLKLDKNKGSDINDITFELSEDFNIQPVGQIMDGEGKKGGRGLEKVMDFTKKKPKFLKNIQDFEKKWKKKEIVYGNFGVDEIQIEAMNMLKSHKRKKHKSKKTWPSVRRKSSKVSSKKPQFQFFSSRIGKSYKEAFKFLQKKSESRLKRKKSLGAKKLFYIEDRTNSNQRSGSNLKKSKSGFFDQKMFIKKQRGSSFKRRKKSFRDLKSKTPRKKNSFFKSYGNFSPDSRNSKSRIQPKKSHKRVKSDFDFTNLKSQLGNSQKIGCFRKMKKRTKSIDARKPKGKILFKEKWKTSRFNRKSQPVVFDFSPAMQRIKNKTQKFGKKSSKKRLKRNRVKSLINLSFLKSVNNRASSGMIKSAKIKNKFFKSYKEAGKSGKGRARSGDYKKMGLKRSPSSFTASNYLKNLKKYNA